MSLVWGMLSLQWWAIWLEIWKRSDLEVDLEVTWLDMLIKSRIMNKSRGQNQDEHRVAKA